MAPAGREIAGFSCGGAGATVSIKNVAPEVINVPMVVDKSTPRNANVAMPFPVWEEIWNDPLKE